MQAMPDGHRQRDHPGRHERVGRPAAAAVDRPGARRAARDLRVRRLVLGARPRHRRPAAGRARSRTRPTPRVLIVAQRVSTIADADQILVLEDGEIVGARHARRAARRRARPTPRSSIPSSAGGSWRERAQRAQHDGDGHGAHRRRRPCDRHRRRAAATDGERRRRRASTATTASCVATAGTQARRARSGPAAASACPAETSEQFGATVRRLGEHPRHRDGRASSCVLVLVGRQRGPRRARPATCSAEATDIIVERRRPAATGIDFGALHRKLLIVARALPRLVGAGRTRRRTSSPGSCSARCTALRESVEHKLNRLPLKLHRRPAPRRPAQPGHQRHRQPRPEPAADDQPDPHVDPHADRRRRS